MKNEIIPGTGIKKRNRFKHCVPKKQVAGYEGQVSNLFIADLLKISEFITTFKLE